MSRTPLLLSFYGDDFTGSTDALESLARCGIRTVLFTDPPTPMDEAGSPLHLAEQTNQPIGLLDLAQPPRPAAEIDATVDRLIAGRSQGVLIDLMHESQQATVGRLIDRCAAREHPLFVVG